VTIVDVIQEQIDIAWVHHKQLRIKRVVLHPIDWVELWELTEERRQPHSFFAGIPVECSVLADYGCPQLVI